MTIDPAVRQLCYVILDDIAATARASNNARISARLVGRVLGVRLGMRTWEAQRIAKAWTHSRHGQRKQAPVRLKETPAKP